MDEKVFIEELKKINIELTNEQLEQLNKYYEMIIEWNKKINLTRITEKKDVYLKHFYDSLTLTKVVDLNKKISICDVGTGAGFPGIVLKIVYPELEMTLIDSLNKRIVFLQEVIKKLNLKDIIAIHDRMENFSRKNQEVFDVITSRAVARAEILTEISMPSLKVGGHLLLMKASCEEELDNSKGIIEETGGKINRIEKFYLPIEESTRTIVDITKIKKTPSKYPRPIDKIKKSL